MGFGVSAPGNERALLLGVFADSADDAEQMLAAGADFVTVTTTRPEDAAVVVKQLDGLVGLRLPEISAEDLDTLTAAGLDFVVVGPETTAAGVVDSEDLGLVLEADESADESQLRALASLELEGVLVGRPIEGFTLQRRILLTRIAMLCGAPLLVCVGPGATSAELGALRESGVSAVLLPAQTKASVVTALLEQLDAVSPRSRRSSRGGDLALLSRPGAWESEHEDND